MGKKNKHAKKDQQNNNNRGGNQTQRINGLANLKDAMTASETIDVNNAAKLENEVGQAARAQVVSEVLAKEGVGEDFTPVPNNPLSKPPKERKSTPRPSKKSKEEIESAAREIKAMAEGKKDAEQAFAEEDKSNEVINPPADADAQSVITGTEDNMPKDEALADLVGTAGDTNVDNAVNAAKEEVTETQAPQEEPLNSDNGGDKEDAEITGQAEDTEATTANEVMEVSEEPASSDDTVITPATNENEDAVTTEPDRGINPEPENAAKEEIIDGEVISETTDNNPAGDSSTGSEPAADQEITVEQENKAAETNVSEATNETAETNESPSEETVVEEKPAAEESAPKLELLFGLTEAWIRKLRDNWLNNRGKVYSIRTKEDQAEDIIAHFANTPQGEIKKQDVLKYRDSYQKELVNRWEANKAAESANAAKVETVSEANDSPAVDNQPAEVTTETVSETTSEIPSESVATGETVETSEEETTVSTEDNAAKVENEGVVPTAPEVDSITGETKDEINARLAGKPTISPDKAEAEETGSQENIPVTDITPEDVENAAKVDTAGIVGNSEVAATTDSNQQGEANNSGEVSNDAAEITPEPENSPKAEDKNDAEATDAAGFTPENADTATPAETDAPVINEADRGITEPDVTKLEAGNQSVGEVTEAKANPTQETGSDGPVKKGKDKITHVGDLSAMESILHNLLILLFAKENDDRNKSYGAKQGMNMLKKWMEDNKYDPKSTSLDYFQLAAKFARENGLVLEEVTGTGFTKDNFRSKIAELFTDKRDEVSAQVAILMNAVSSPEALRVVIPDNLDELDLEETRKVVNALRVYYNRTIDIMQHLVRVQQTSNFVEHKLTKRQFLVYRAAVTEMQAMEIAKLKSDVQRLNTEAGIAKAKISELENRNEGLMDVITDTLATKADAEDGVSQAITEEQQIAPVNNQANAAIQEGASDTDPKVITQPLSMYLRVRGILRTLYLLVMLPVMQKRIIASAQKKLERNLISHRQQFLNQPQHAAQVYKTDSYYKVYQLKTEDGFEDEYAYEEVEVITKNFLDADDRIKLDEWRNTKQEDGKSPLDRHYYRNAITDGTEFSARLIENPQPGIIPTVGSRIRSVNIPDMRDKTQKDLPIEDNKSTNIPMVAREFPEYPNILERLTLYQRATNDDTEKDFHVLIFSEDNIHSAGFEKVMTKHLEDMINLNLVTISAVDYIAQVRGISVGLGNPRHHTIDLFSLMSLPGVLARRMVSDLLDVSVSAFAIQYPPNPTALVGVSRDLPISVYQKNYRALTRDDGSETYMKLTAAYDMQKYFPNVNWVVVTKHYEYGKDNAGNPLVGYAANLNIYWKGELTIDRVMNIVKSENATSNKSSILIASTLDDAKRQLKSEGKELPIIIDQPTEVINRLPL